MVIKRESLAWFNECVGKTQGLLGAKNVNISLTGKKFDGIFVGFVIKSCILKFTINLDNTARKVSVFGVFLVRIFPHSD